MERHELLSLLLFEFEEDQEKGLYNDKKKEVKYAFATC